MLKRSIVFVLSKKKYPDQMNDSLPSENNNKH